MSRLSFLKHAKTTLALFQVDYHVHERFGSCGLIALIERGKSIRPLDRWISRFWVEFYSIAVLKKR